MGPSRLLVVNWRSVHGAATGKRKLSIRENNKGLFSCPIVCCLHDDFRSSRGLRKHITNKHPWYYYFDKQPEIKREELEIMEQTKKKSCTAKKAAFSLHEGVGKEFLDWLRTTCGGGKSLKEAQQIGKRAMKFLMESLGNNESDLELSYEFIDCCLSSPNIFITFIKILEKEWKLSSSATLNYVKAIGDILDFRKTFGVSDSTLRCFTVTEVYVRRAKENLRKKKNIECHRNLHLESLIAKDSWASIDEMEYVIPYHVQRYKNIVSMCKDGNHLISKRDLVFCTRFITTLLFLRVKCSRPMTYQYLTVEMVEKAKVNGGFIDQTEFKTASKYIFDTLVITNDVMQTLDLYLIYVRPKLNPKCEYLLLSTNGTQFQSLTTAMLILVHEAIGKYINPTRYRQIVETESSERLSREEQDIITEDQKHSSTVAKIFYKKKKSRVVAMEGKKCMDKMTQEARKTHDSLEILNDINQIDKHFDQNVLSTSRLLIERDNDGIGCSKDLNENVNPYDPISDDSMDLVITKTTDSSGSTNDFNMFPRVPTNDIVIKKEVVNCVTQMKNIKFTSQEDAFLQLGILKYGRKAWAQILKDKAYNFHVSRTRDSLRMRAESRAFKSSYPLHK